MEIYMLAGGFLIVKSFTQYLDNKFFTFLFTFMLCNIVHDAKWLDSLVDFIMHAEPIVNDQQVVLIATRLWTAVYS